MNEHLGISFTNRSISLTVAGKNGNGLELLNTQDILYPFSFEFNAFKNEQNIDMLAERIATFVQNNNLTGCPCSVSVPMYMTQMKRAAIPPENDERILQRHFKWELENINSSEIEAFKVIKLEHEFTFGAYQESVFILVQKQILARLLKLIEKSALKADKILLDSDTLFKFLKAANLLDENKNQLIFQLDVFNVVGFLFLKGKFYNYTLHSMVGDQGGKTFEAKIAGIIENEIQHTRQLVQQLPGYDLPLQVFTTRVVTEKLQSYLAHGEVPVKKLSVDDYAEFKDINVKNIESFAVML